MKHLTYFLIAISVCVCRPAFAANLPKACSKAAIDPPSAGISANENPHVGKTDPRRRSMKSVINQNNADDYFIESEEVSYLAMQLINVAESKLGSGYHGGGTNKDSGFDCSGLMFSTFQKFDITLPRSSNEMAKIGRKLESSEVKKGDLIFFRTNGKSVINHVGMVTEVSDDEIKFVHSSTHEGVVISSTKEPYYRRTFAQVNRILD